MRPTARRTSTTVVSVVGTDAGAWVERLGEAANVVPVRPEIDDPPLDRAVAAWAEAVRAHSPYLVHDADPLAAVADAWVRRFDEAGPIGELEVAVSETLARWRAGSIEMPDYYLVLDAESWTPTRRHWYLGVLHAAAPARVVPVPDPDAAARMLPRLGAGAWWPDLDDLLGGIEQVVPDQVVPAPAGSSARIA
ncbi:MAG: hypothetical protein QOF40_564 [Actinomycetota bacterium]|jgi:hypothetical protein|nr:hypothetical protein [Actinomycetota bacterium]